MSDVNEFALDGVRYVAQDDASFACHGCAFTGDARCHATPNCSSRDDGRNIVWVRAEPEAATPPAPTQDGSQAAVVDRSYSYRPITPETPRGKLMVVANRQAGVAKIGVIRSGDDFWTHWAPLPVFED